MFLEYIKNLLIDTLPMLVLVLILAIVLKIIISFYNKKIGNIYNEIKIFLYIIYVFLLFVVVTSRDYQSYSSNFTPFKEILRYNFMSKSFFVNVIGNIAIFIPFGYLISDTIYIFTKKKNYLLNLFVIFFISLSIETVQTFIERSFDVDDVILNIIGGLIGILIFKIVNLIKGMIKHEK